MTRFILADLPVQCTALPEDIPNLKTSTKLPVYHGTNLKVECGVGYSRLGSSVITCTKEKTWSYTGDTPSCAAGRCSFPVTQLYLFWPLALHESQIRPHAHFFNNCSVYFAVLFVSVVCFIHFTCGDIKGDKRPHCKFRCLKNRICKWNHSQNVWNHNDNMIPYTDCTTLNSLWKSNVLTIPTLPANHGAEISFTCAAGYLNEGGNMATCREGQVIPKTIPPQCSAVCMLHQIHEQ